MSVPALDNRIIHPISHSSWEHHLLASACLEGAVTTSQIGFLSKYLQFITDERLSSLQSNLAGATPVAFRACEDAKRGKLGHIKGKKILLGMVMSGIVRGLKF